MRRAVRRIAQAFRDFAASQGWGPDDYRLLFSVNEDWGQVQVIFVAAAFPGSDEDERWMKVYEFVEKNLKDEPSLWNALHFTLRTFDQLAEGGLYSIAPGFVDVEDILVGGPSAEK